jgi:hypothetical protein
VTNGLKGILKSILESSNWFQKALPNKGLSDFMCGEKFYVIPRRHKNHGIQGWLSRFCTNPAARGEPNPVT